MGINKTVSKARLDAALANGTIKENDITFVKDTENYEGIVVGNGNNPLRFHTVPSPTSQDTEKILQVDNNGIPKWNTIEEKSTFDGSKTITENLNLGGSLNVTGAVTAQSMTLGSSPTTSSNNMQVPTTAWVNAKLNGKAGIESPTFTGTPKSTTPTSTDNSTRIATTAFVKQVVSDYVPNTDSRLTDGRTPTGQAGGDLAGTYPDPTIADSVYLPGSPTTTTPDGKDRSNKLATTSFVQDNILVPLFVNYKCVFKTAVYQRGGTKKTTDPCLLSMVFISNYALLVAVGNTSTSVTFESLTSYASNLIYQDKDGFYVNFLTLSGGIPFPNSLAYVYNENNVRIRSIRALRALPISDITADTVKTIQILNYL